MATTLSDNLSEQFADLSPEDQAAVAERLLAIQNSDWKPFWCKRRDCDGMPHLVYDEDGLEVMVGVKDTEGPNGEPVSDIVYLDKEGDLWLPDTHNPPTQDDTPYGRLVYEMGWGHNHAREDQRLPPWRKPWVLFIMSGRGAGKTRTGIEFVTLCARKGLNGAIVGRRGIELKNTHVAEILAHAHPDFMPIHWASKDLLEWPEVTLPNGKKVTPITYLFSAETPENIRSVNLSYFWFDEAAHMDEVETAWTNARFAARVKSAGNPIHILITSTPTPTPWVMKMEDNPKVMVRRVSTYANKANLDPEFIAELEEDYEGTRIGRQELHGEVLRDVEGALWNDGLFRHLRFLDADGIPSAVRFQAWLQTLDDRQLAVDPAGSKGPRSDAHGIIAAGVQHFDEHGDPLPASTFWVLGDATIKGTPSERSAQVFKAARYYDVSRIVVEKNFGGEDVKQGLIDYAKLHPEEACNYAGEEFVIELKHASQSKETRAEPTVGKYEQGRVTHVLSDHHIGDVKAGDLSMMEKEQAGWVPKSRGGRMPSPNRIDALVWVIRSLESNIRHATQMAGSNVMSHLKRTA